MTAHDHLFGQDKPSVNEKRTLIVVIITAITMVVEIGAGLTFGSMALLADGLHMASHAVALGITVFAYRYARKHAADPRFSFGTGKVNSLAGFSGAILLGVFALGMAAESLDRFIHPVDIAINQALIVAVLGLIVNGASVFILGLKHHVHDDHDHHHHDHKHDHHDHNFKSAYFHVLADALTSVLAIGALLSAKYWGYAWMDPAMGIVGAILVARWSVGLMKESAWVLLDVQAEDATLNILREKFEALPDTTVSDLHVWMIAPGKRAMIVSISSSDPKSAAEYLDMVPDELEIVHSTFEVSKKTT